VAKERNVLRPAEYASRAARLVELITGRRPTSRRFDEACPPGYEPLLEVSPNTHAVSNFAYLARVCRHAAHFDAPRTFPSFARLYEAGRDLAQLEGAAEGAAVPNSRVHRRLIQSFSCYRTARRLLVEGKTGDELAAIEAEFAFVDSFRNRHHACHLGV